MYRVLVIKTPNYKHTGYTKAKVGYQKRLKEFHDRLVKKKVVIGSPFKITLIGFDGKAKKSWKEFDAKAILNAIDAMPMGAVRKSKGNLSLYAPKKSTKGLGYKDKETAIKTLKTIKKRDKKYQMAVVNTMIGRAKHHPNQTKDMREAIKVYQKWKKSQSKS